MAANGTKLFKVASQINIGRDAIVEYLGSKGFEVKNRATSVLTDEMVDVVMDKFAKEIKVAEKQREKVKRQAAVRKNLIETGSTVSIDSIAEKQAIEEEIEDRMSNDDSSHRDEATVVEEVIVEEAPAVVEEPVAEVEDESKAKAQSGPAVGQVIDLSNVGKKPAPKAKPEPVTEAVAEPTKEPAKEPVAEAKVEAPAETAVEEYVAEETETAASKPANAAEEPKAKATDKEKADSKAKPDSEEKTNAKADAEAPAQRGKRKRKGVIEVELKGGTSTKLRGLTVLGKIDVSKAEERPKKQRKQSGNRGGGAGKATIGDAVGVKKKDGENKVSQQTTTSSPVRGRGPNAPAGGVPRADDRNKKRRGATRGKTEQFSDSDVNRAIRQTLSGIEDRGPSGGRSKIRQKRRVLREEKEAIRQEERERESTILRLSEFVTTGDLANLMSVTPADIIMKCMGLGLMVSINQRLDKETIEVIASDYNYKVEFLDDQVEFEIEEVEDSEEDLKPRSPIVTIMGHVDHGKTSLLDYIRNATVVAGEAGGITQHIGAYRVELPDGRHISFLDTPGHEAFTAMRARGAQVTDIVVLVVSADDSVMPQTIEAISHAQAAGVPIVVAINKIDRPDANPERIKQQLSDYNVLVEEWGGKVQAVPISAKTGENIDQLLEKILLEADLLDLKANPDREARGVVIEAHLDKGRGNVVTVMIQKGTLDIGDIFVCGQYAGRVRAMTDERGNRVESAGPTIPVQVTGFDGLPNAGDVLLEMESDAEAREIGNRRQILRREQQFRGMRHLTLDDISAQIQQGGVKELRLVVKTDVGGSLEALSDSLLKLSTPEVQVRIIHRGVGAITESDIMLAAASDAVIVGFQVSIGTAVHKTAQAESVDVRLYSIIYDCINEVQLALEGLLTPDIKEEITATVEVRATFKISRLGVIAGCYVTDGSINRNDRVRILREGFEIFKGTLASLKRVKDDAKDVAAGYECGIGVNGFNDISEGDIIEAYRTIEVKRKLA